MQKKDCLTLIASLICIVVLSLPIFSQESFQITLIISKGDGTPIPYSQIFIKETGRYYQSKEEGSLSVSVPQQGFYTFKSETNTHLQITEGLVDRLIELGKHF
ncbi:MAG: hypothetical protein AAF518_15795, partial [Spirochaetota bacterium]